MNLKLMGMCLTVTGPFFFPRVLQLYFGLCSAGSQQKVMKFITEEADSLLETTHLQLLALVLEGLYPWNQQWGTIPPNYLDWIVTVEAVDPAFQALMDYIGVTVPGR